jgi:hypothetical protein
MGGPGTKKLPSGPGTRLAMITLTGRFILASSGGAEPSVATMPTSLPSSNKIPSNDSVFWFNYAEELRIVAEAMS